MFITCAGTPGWINGSMKCWQQTSSSYSGHKRGLNCFIFNTCCSLQKKKWDLMYSRWCYNYILLEYDAIQYGRETKKFQRNLPPLGSKKVTPSPLLYWQRW
jgi:hypothetical protein